MPTKKPEIARSLDTAWTWIGSILFASCVAVWFFIRSGGTSFFPSANNVLQDDAVVSAAYWGLLISGAGLCVLGALALRFKKKGFHKSGFGWPRYTLLEGDVRDGLVARVAFLAVTIVPGATFVAALVAYSNSRIALWNENVPLADGFIESRIAAFRSPCDDQPCFRMHPLDGVEPYAIQWFTWLNEPLVIVLFFIAIVVWLFWAFACSESKPI